MPRPRSTMRKIREILRLSLGDGLSRPPDRRGHRVAVLHDRRPPRPCRTGRAGLAAARGYGGQVPARGVTEVLAPMAKAEREPVRVHASSCSFLPIANTGAP